MGYKNYIFETAVIKSLIGFLNKLYQIALSTFLHKEINKTKLSNQYGEREQTSSQTTILS
jgi:hypothetical protein